VNADAAGQRWSAEDYARNGRFVAELAAPLLDWLAPQRDERVLDLGCGDGALTAKIAAAGAVVEGADASPELVAAAQARGLSAHVVDGQALPYADAFDAVFSNAALHWMKHDPAAVIAGVLRALKPGGRFVAEMGADGNCASIRAALHDALCRRGADPDAADPWYFPTATAYRGLLESAGFEVVRIERFDRPTPLPGELSAWLRTFAQAFLAVLPAEAHAAVLDEVQTVLQPTLFVDGRWLVDYVRLRFDARKAPA